MANRVTVQDIADALGISRNTVSKAINNAPGLAPATRERVLQKAAEMGYKQFSYLSLMTQGLSHAQKTPVKEDASPTAPGVGSGSDSQEIALLMEGFQDSSHFAHPMLDKFQREISQLGYIMTIHHLNGDEVDQLRLPMTFRPERTSGILCVELFSEPYARMLCSLGIPTLFVDTPVILEGDPLPTDILLMENQSGIVSFIREMVRQGRKEIGFVGHAGHCRSFFERYLAFRNAMHLCGLTIREEFCLTSPSLHKRYPSQQEYHALLREQLSDLTHLPDAFICANDFVAGDLLLLFREMGVVVPRDVMLCGFDDSPEASILTPSLTSIHIHSQIMGLSAAQLLTSRIQEPEMNFRTIHTETDLIYRESAPAFSL